ncbi:MAG TPA: TetR/AcrR family transcriptional regulator [Deltaproteobacteria bacterium]|nr:TetR/AcrR family transcriptional regulator [Deltaproteobacteria bacterium]
MGRSEEVEALRQRILGEATRLFAEQGYDGTSLQQIAKASGVSKALVLYHFSSKEGLKHEAASKLVRAWESLLPRLMLSITGGGDPIETVLQETLAFLRTEVHLPRFVLRELINANSDLGESLAQRVQPTTDLAVATLQPDLPKGADPAAILTLVGISALSIHALFPPDADGMLKGPDDLGERVLAEAVRVARLALGAGSSETISPDRGASGADSAGAGPSAPGTPALGTPELGTPELGTPGLGTPGLGTPDQSSME